MTEESTRPTGENGRQAVAVRGEAGVTDGVNAWMESMKAASIDGAIDRAARVAKRSRQLPNRNDAVLPFCELRKGA